MVIPMPAPSYPGPERRAARPVHALALDELDYGVVLLDGGGAERVRRADHDGQAERVAQVPRELADAGRLAGPVDADDEDHRGLVPQVDRLVAGAGELGEELGQPAGQRLAADEGTIVGELNAVQGSPRDLGGYYYVDKAKTDAVMRPSATFNRALAEF